MFEFLFPKLNLEERENMFQDTYNMGKQTGRGQAIIDVLEVMKIVYEGLECNYDKSVFLMMMSKILKM